MQDRLKQDPIIQHMIRWGEARADVRALVLTSTLTNPYVPVDLFSDYDLIAVVTDIHPYLADESWLEDFGRVLVLYRDPVRLEYGYECFARITQYENSTKIDFSIMPVEVLRRIAAESQLPDYLEVGYTVLLDKDKLTIGLRAPTYRAFIPAPPEQTEYQRVVEEFFHESTYLAKNLWRGELMPSKYFLDKAMKLDNLRLMLEWRMEIDHDWSVKVNVFGKGLHKCLPPDIWTELEHTYVGSVWDENWAAMYRTIDLFSRVAVEVAAHLGYAYPHELERRVVAYLRKVEQLPREATTFS